MKKKTKKRDLLKDLYNGKITEDEAYDLYDEALEFTKGWEREELFGLSRIETTADAHGMPLSVIAKWRFEGWPENCPICHKKIVPEKFGLPGALAWITNTSWAGFFFFISLLLLLGQIWSIYQGIQSKKWPTAEGVVIQSSVRISPGGDSGDLYEPRICYGYSISGEPYESNSISHKQNPNTTSRGPAVSVISKYPKGSRVRVYYDPNNPINAVLETGLGDGWPFLLLMLFFATTIGTGIWAYVVWPGLNFDNIRGLFSLQ